MLEYQPLPRRHLCVFRKDSGGVSPSPCWDNMPISMVLPLFWRTRLRTCPVLTAVPRSPRLFGMHGLQLWQTDRARGSWPDAAPADSVHNSWVGSLALSQPGGEQRMGQLIACQHGSPWTTSQRGTHCREWMCSPCSSGLAVMAEPQRSWLWVAEDWQRDLLSHAKPAAALHFFSPSSFFFFF